MTKVSRRYEMLDFLEAEMQALHPTAPPPASKLIDPTVLTPTSPVPTLAAASVGTGEVAQNTSRRRERSRIVFAELTATFLRLIGQPSAKRPTVRCLSHADALKLVLKARAVIDDPELRGYSAESLIETFTTSGILQPLALEAAGSISVYSIGPQISDSVGPIEILEAMYPAGVICYFTALQFYGLTTQIATHHHIASLVKRPPSNAFEVRESPPKPANERKASSRQRDPLGTLLFRYQAQPYYRTDRGTHTIAGIQLRSLNDKTIARITTREQTLLDTLHRPMSCGGPSVVWEAWSRGIAEFDPVSLAELLRQLDDSRLLRRVGYMLQSQDFPASEMLADILKEARVRARTLDDEESIPLLPGIPGTRIDPDWRLRLP